MDAMEAITELTDNELITSLKELVGHSNQLTAELLRHLAEVEHRRLHLEAACSSMHVYCTEVLGFDDATAYNRIYVARLARRFPVVLDWLAEGRVHLTGLRLLAPHITEDNLVELLEAAAGKTKRQIEKLIAERAPKPDVPDRVRKRPQPTSAAASPAACSGACSPEATVGGGVGTFGSPSELTDNDAGPAMATEAPGSASAAAHTAVIEPHQSSSATPSSATPRAVADKAEPRSADRYKIEFTAGAEVVDRLERVQALMAHREPGCGFEVVVEQALELLEAKLLKERFGVGAKPREAKPERRHNNSTNNDNGKTTTRHVPIAVRREVYERDGLQCAFVDPESGRRCGEAAVELQHHRPYALGGEHSADNLSLFCSVHNAHAARKEFGQAHIEAAVQRQRCRRAARKAREARQPVASAQPAAARSTAQLRPTTAAQLGLFGS